MSTDPSKTDFNDLDAVYLAEETARRKEAIQRSDSEKFLHFTGMMRINNTLEKARIMHKKQQ